LKAGRFNPDLVVSRNQGGKAVNSRRICDGVANSVRGDIRDGDSDVGRDRSRGVAYLASDDAAWVTGQTLVQLPLRVEANGSVGLSLMPVSCGDSTAPIGPG